MTSLHERRFLLRALRKALRHAVALCAVMWVYVQADLVYGQQDPVSKSDDAAESVEVDEVRPSFELGRFSLRELRFSSNVTPKILFSMHLALPEGTDKKTVKRLEQWKHRLRDQVIIAVRRTEIKYFLEPDLALLRRNILLRINRLLKASLVDEVYLTEFTFTTH